MFLNALICVGVAVAAGVAAAAAAADVAAADVAGVLCAAYLWPCLCALGAMANWQPVI